LAPVENHLIASLPRKDRLRLLALCEPVRLVLAEVLCEPGSPTRHVYFPTEGFISLVAQIDGTPALEVGMVGREGMLGAHLALGVVTAPLHALVQGAGAAWRIATPAFRAELARSVPLQRGLHRYLYVLMAQLAASAACLRFHQIGPRLARWLLMTQDRAHADRFHVTHEFLSYMLGVRRVGITAAAGLLQRGGLITYRRGELTVLDRSGLEAAACGCYATDRKAYAELMD
jgi:CRP-like cAMP-binding protein